MRFAALAVFAYLLGSVPFALIIARLLGKDLRKVGSGNIGATNLARAAGRKWGYVCFILDFAKGFVPMMPAVMLISDVPEVMELVFALVVGAAAIIGHVFPLYIGFKGGKGVATGFGVAMGFWPYFTIPALFAIAAWIIVVMMWRYISLGSIIAAAVLPIALLAVIVVRDDWRLDTLWPIVVAAFAIGAMVILRHRANISRLRQGTESRIFEKKQQ